MNLQMCPDYEFLRPFVEKLPERFEAEGETIFQGRNLLKRFQENGLSLIVKRFRIPHWINRIAYITVRKSKAARSFENGLILQARGIPTPHPIAYLETYFFGLSYSYYVTLEAQGMQEIRCFCPEGKTDAPPDVLDAFGRYTAEMHRKGVLHADYTPGNILFKTNGREATFSLVDINRLRFGTVTEEMGYKNLDRLWLPDELYKRVATAYAVARGYDADYAWRRIFSHKEKIERKYGNRNK